MRVLPGRPVTPDGVIDVLDAPQRAARRRLRWRLAVFAAVAALCLAAGQAWNYARPDEYRASLRLQLPAAAAAAGASAPADAPDGVGQGLTSRPLLDRLAQAMAAAGQPLAPAADAAVARLQAMLQVQPQAGGELLLLATGPQPAQLVALLEAWTGLIRAELAARQQAAVAARRAAAQQALAQLDQAAAARGDELASWQARASLRGDRDAPAPRSDPALPAALQRLAAAEARLQALRDGGGDAPADAPLQEEPRLAALQVRASLAREALRDLAHAHSAEALAADPAARALRRELADLAQQIGRLHAAGPAAAPGAAQQALADARAEVAQRRARSAAPAPAQAQAQAQAQVQGQKDALARLQASRQALQDHLARLAAEARRPPAVTVVSPARVAASPMRPDRRRDTLWVLGSALLAGALAAGGLALFSRPARPPPPGRWPAPAGPDRSAW